MPEGCHAFVTLVLVCCKTLYRLRYTGCIFLVSTPLLTPLRFQNSDLNNANPVSHPDKPTSVYTFVRHSCFIVCYEGTDLLFLALLLWLCLNIITYGFIALYTHTRTGYTQKNGAVSKVNKKCISHLTRGQCTPSAAATVQVSRALPAVRFTCLLRGRGASFQDGVAAGKGFLCAPF